jgi:hypothetical protein
MIVVNINNGLLKIFVFLKIWYSQASVSRQRSFRRAALRVSPNADDVLSGMQLKGVCEFCGLRNGVAENPFRSGI